MDSSVEKACSKLFELLSSLFLLESQAREGRTANGRNGLSQEDTEDTEADETAADDGAGKKDTPNKQLQVADFHLAI